MTRKCVMPDSCRKGWILTVVFVYAIIVFMIIIGHDRLMIRNKEHNFEHTMNMVEKTGYFSLFTSKDKQSSESIPLTNILYYEDKESSENILLASKDKQLRKNTRLISKDKLSSDNKLLTSKDTISSDNTLFTSKDKLSSDNTLFTSKDKLASEKLSSGNTLFTSKDKLASEKLSSDNTLFTSKDKLSSSNTLFTNKNKLASEKLSSGNTLFTSKNKLSSEKPSNDNTLLTSKDKLSSENTLFTSKDKLSSENTDKTIVIGILSRSENLCLREAQRKMFLPRAKAYKPLTVKVFFLIDHSTPELEEEQRINQDIVFLNTTIHGWSKHFESKLHSWLKYAVVNFPDAILIGRMDDDVFVCAPQIFDRLNEVKHELLYYGYPTGSKEYCPTQECVDEMFLFVGRELGRRVARRQLCQGRRDKNCLDDTNENAGHAFRRWIGIYNDFVFVNERRNGLMVWFYHDSANAINLRKFRTFNFCQKYLLYHKASIIDIYRMNQSNSLLLNDNSSVAISEEDIKKATNCPIYKH